jgi:hypothetical protein
MHWENITSEEDALRITKKSEKKISRLKMQDAHKYIALTAFCHKLLKFIRYTLKEAFLHLNSGAEGRYEQQPLDFSTISNTEPIHEPRKSQETPPDVTDFKFPSLGMKQH